MPGSKVGIVQDEAIPAAANLDATVASLRAHVPALNACLKHTTEAADDSHQGDVKELQTLTAEATRHVDVCADEVEQAAKLLREIEADL